MIRVLFYVVLVFALAAGFAWLAERPGDLTIVWQGYEIRTTLLIAAVGLALAITAVALFGALVRALIRTPRSVGAYLGGRRRDRGYRALTRGMIAVGAGDPRAARRAAEESRTLLGGEPLVLLLTAQAAQIAGDAGAAREAFEALTSSRDTRLLGLHGLFVEARRQGERTAARHFAEEAMLISPRIGWAGTALFEYQCQGHEWQAALATLSTNADAGTVPAARANRLRAVLLTARAMELEAGRPDEARALAYEAHRLAGDLVPAAVVAARLLTRNGEVRRAMKVLEATWRAEPHPDLAEAYLAVRPGDSVRDRLKRMRRLADLRPTHPEGAMALARAAIDARDWPAARGALAGLVRTDPTERTCLLMAEIEEGETGDQGRARTWLRRAAGARRDPVWTADGRVFDAWAPVSPVSGRTDVFEWRTVAEPPAAPREALLAAAGEAEPPKPAPQPTANLPAVVTPPRPDGARPPGPPATIVPPPPAAPTTPAAPAHPVSDDPGPFLDEETPARSRIF
jgi:HemY protein